MKIHSRLFLILLCGLSFIILLTIVLNIFINRENSKLLKEKLADTQERAAPKALAIITSNLKNYSFDYSVWDQMVNFVNNPKDTTWATEEIDIPLSAYNIDYTWVIDADAKEVYYSVSKNNPSDKKLPVSPGLLKKELTKNPFKHFFTKKNNEIVEVFAAPIQPTSDIKRVTKPTGYLLLGVNIDSEYINTLHEIDNETMIVLAGQNNKHSTEINSSNGSVQFSIPLNSIEGDTVAVFNVKKDYPVLATYKKFLSRYFFAFIFILFTLSIIFLLLSKRMLFYPLHSITSALSENNPKKIIRLQKSKTEYGQLSKLVVNFFEQRDFLKKEIECRIKTEIDLINSMQEKENAIIEKTKAEHSALVKSDFLSVMSHEIRTPINGVIGISNLLLDEELNSRQKEYVQTLNFSAQHLLSLVSDILDFSKIESGNLEIERTSFNLEKLCQHVFDLYKGKADEKAIHYTYTPSTVNEYSLYGDPTRISQVLSNLLSNAIKFTDKGSVDFSYSVKEENNHKTIIVFKVKDSGIGIEKSNQSKIFDSFSQADQSVTRKYGGTGLGLTISKKLIELQGGSISVNSEHGTGSEFTIVLPVDKHVYTDKEALEKNVQKTLNQSLKGMKILIAEDNTINAMVLTRFLDKWNTEYKVAKDGAEAVRLAQNEKFDIILMDLQMPVMDGEEATAIIRESEKESISKIPIVAFTADALIDNHRKLLKKGFDHCITKPFNPDALLKYLQEHQKNVA